MQTNFRVHSSLGGVELIVEDDSPGVPQPIARFCVPKQIEAEAGVELIRRAYHNSGLSDNHKKMLRSLVEAFGPE